MAFTPAQNKELREVTTRLKVKTEEAERLKLERAELKSRQAELRALKKASSNSGDT